MRISTPGIRSSTSIGMSSSVNCVLSCSVIGAAVLLASGCAKSGASGARAEPAVVSHAQNDSGSDGDAWTEMMRCGGKTYRLRSHCVASGSDMELNSCSRQDLTIGTGGAVIDLPNPLPEDRESLNIKALFVVQWGCSRVGGSEYGVLYYSTGGGTGIGSENVEFYAPSGTRIDPGYADWRELNQKWRDDLRPVKSIMPLEGTQ